MMAILTMVAVVFGVEWVDGVGVVGRRSRRILQWVFDESEEQEGRRDVD